MTSAAKANRRADIVDRLEAEIERLRGPDQSNLCVVLSEENDALIEENKRLRVALTEILADLDDPDLIDISAATIARARQALNIHKHGEA